MESQPRFHLPSLVQLVVSLLAALVGLGVAALLFVSGLLELSRSGLQPAGEDLAVFSLAWSAGLVSLLLLPSAYFSLLRLMNRPTPALRWRGRYAIATLLVMVWPLVVWLTIPLARGSAAWLLVPPLLLAAVAIPIWWYLETGRRGLKVGRPQRSWGVVAFTAVVTVPLILTVEVLFLVGLVAGLGAWVSTRPELAQLLMDLWQALQSGLITREQLLEQLLPLLERPVFLYLAVFVVGLLMPMVEELLKPLALWLLNPREMTPMHGFWVGMLSGATFALLETLGNLGSLASTAVTEIVVARFGTGLLHIVTSGLVGYGIASAWHEKRFGLLALMFVLAAAIHSAWNTFGIVIGFSPLLGEAAVPASPLLAWMGRASLPTLAGVLVLNLALLLGMNRSLRARYVETHTTEPVPGPNAPA